jgi:hypothetical protein
MAMAAAWFVAAERRKRRETPTGKPAPISSVNQIYILQLTFWVVETLVIHT